MAPLVLPLGFAITFQLQWRAARAELDAAIDSARARSEPVYFADLSDLPVEEPNGAGFLIQAILELRGETVGARGRVLSRSAENAVETKPKPGVYPEFEAALKAGGEALALLERAVKLPPGRFTKDFHAEFPGQILLPYLGDYRTMAQLLAIEAIDALGRNDSRRAFRAVVQCLKLSNLLAEEPLFIVQLMRIAIARRGLDLLETCLAYAEPSPKEFADIDEALALVGRFSWRIGILAERAILLAMLDHPYAAAGRGWSLYKRNTPAKLPLELAYDWLKDRYYASKISRPDVMRAQAFLLVSITKIMETADVDGPEADRRMEAFRREYFAAAGAYPLLREFPFVIGYTSLPSEAVDLRTRGKRFRQQVMLARLGLRVNQFRVKRGRPPLHLEEVGDQQVPVEPTPLFDGKPPLYTSDAKHFVLSISSQPGDEETRRFEVRWVKKSLFYRRD